MNLLELTATLGLDKKDFDTGLNDASSKASSFAKGVGNVAKVAAGAFAATTAATVAGTKAFIDGMSSVAQFGDNIDKMSQKMNMSATAYQEWSFVMEHAGTSIDSMQMSIKTLSNAVATNKDAFEELGMTQEQIASMSGEDLFAATITALQGVEDETKRTYLAGQLLGRGATELGPLLNMSAEELSSMKQQAHELGGVLSDETVKDAAHFQDSLQNMQTALTGAKNAMLGDFLPAFTTTMDGLSAIFSRSDIDGGLVQIQEGIKGLADGIAAKAPEVMQIGGTILQALLSSITTNLPVLLDAAVPVVTELVTGILNNLPTVVSAAGTLLKTLGEGFIENFPVMLSVMQSLVLMIGQALADNAPSIIPAIVNLITTMMTTFTDPSFLMPVLDAGLSIIEGLVNGMIQAIPILVGKLPVIIDNIISVVMKGIPMVLNAAIQLFGAIVKALPTIIQSLNTALPQIIMMILEQLPTIINNVSSFLIDSMPMIMDAAIMLFNGIVDAIPVILDLLMVLLPDIIQSICDFLVDSMPVIMDSSITLLMAIVQAIPKIVTALAQQLPMIISAILNTFSSNLPAIIQGAIQLLMGIIEAIPTIVIELGKNMPQIIGAILAGIASGTGSIFSAGVNLIQGLWNGIASMKDWIWSKIKDFGGGIVQALKNFFGIHSPSTLFENEIGKNLALGLGEGFSNEMGSVIDKMTAGAEDAANAVKDPFDNIKLTSAINATGATVKVDSPRSEASKSGGVTTSDVGAIVNAVLGNMQLTVPVYIGQRKIDQQVATANARNNVISGGR